MTNLEKDILNSTQLAIGKAIGENLTGYHNPLSKLITEVVDSHRNELKEIIESNFTKVIRSKEFDKSVKNAFNHKLAKILVSKLEGSVEKCVNTLRSDPIVRARMILAIEDIIRDYDPEL